MSASESAGITPSTYLSRPSGLGRYVRTLPPVGGRPILSTHRKTSRQEGYRNCLSFQNAAQLRDITFDCVSSVWGQMAASPHYFPSMRRCSLADIEAERCTTGTQTQENSAALSTYHISTAWTQPQIRALPARGVFGENALVLSDHHPVFTSDI